MSDSYGQPSDEQVAEWKMQQAAHQKDVEQIVSLGHERAGESNFDAASSNVASAMGDKVGEFTSVIKQLDSPVELIMHLSDNPDRLEKISKMPPARMLTALAKIQSEIGGAASLHDTSASPAWARPEARASNRISDATWNSPESDRIPIDRWMKEHDRRYREKSEKRGW